ncbi:MAG: 3'-5' exonuclease [Alteromonadaceae bacterium]|nr:3'-5' exonuclease [Alteromonadaceae bacterium]|tara:strand:+ start:160 stop:2139 length:1980 start_codon:yes stop_codon:yes gene_type:complete
MFNTDALQQLRQLKSEIKTQKDLQVGTIKLSATRFGFVTLDDGREIYLPQEQAQRVLPGDRVEVSLETDDKGKPHAILEKALRKTAPRFVGQYQVRGNGHFVAPDLPGLNRWLFVPPKARQNASPGDFVVAQVSRHPFSSGNGQVEITQVLGSAQEPGIERKYTLAKHELEEEWPAPVLAEAEALGEEDIARLAVDREDLTHLPFVTIDAISTQDMDDALMAEQVDGGWRLRVAIADPASLLKADGAIERLARERVMSGYMPGGVRPMLPEVLANQLCSLRPGCLRLALICTIQVDDKGALGEFSFSQGVIKSWAKLSYDAVAGFLGSHLDESLKSLPDEALNSLYQLGEAAQAMRQWRNDHALLTEERPDYRMRLDEKGKIRSIDKVWPTAAHKLVEECMVAANRCAADFLQAQGDKGLFIVHRGIREEKVGQVKTLLKALEGPLQNEDPGTAEGYKRILQNATSNEDTLALRAIVLRQLERAEMAFTAAPHQGMGLASYTTFTSPLRKYTDLFVHRLIRNVLQQESAPQLSDDDLAKLQQDQMRLRRVVSEIEQWLKCQFAPTLGDRVQSGRIVKVTSPGFLVRLDETGLEGFVTMKDLEGKFSFDPVRLTLTGKKLTFQLDQSVQVVFKSVDQERRQIHFRMAENQPQATSASTAT